MKLFLQWVFLFSPVFVFTQPESNISISIDKLKGLYLGVENPVKINVPGVDSKDIIVKTDNGVITGENGTYILKLSKLGFCILEIYNGDKFLEKKEIPVHKIPKPLVYFGELTGDANTTRDKLISEPCLRVEIPNFPYDIKFTVTSFQMTVAKKGAKDKLSLFNYTATSNCLNDEMIKVLKNDKIASTIYFENIRVQGPAGQLRMPPITLRLAGEILKELEIERIKVKSQEIELTKKEVELLKQDSILAIQLSEIEGQRNELKKGENSINEQQVKIKKQKNKLSNQILQLNNQETIIIISFCVIGLIILLMIIAIRSYILKRRANKLLGRQNEIINQKQKEILDSIYYARRIQQSILPSEKQIDKNLKRINKG